MRDLRVDFSKPIQHAHQGVKQLSYIGRMEARDGKPIDDGCNHLLLVGSEMKAIWVDDCGRTAPADDKAAYRVISNVPEPKPAPQPTANNQAIDLTGIATVKDLADMRDDLHEELRLIKRQLHVWSEAAGRLNTELKGSIEAVIGQSREANNALIETATMVLDDIKRAMTGQTTAQPVIQAQPTTPHPGANRKVINLPRRDDSRIDLNELNKIDSADLKTRIADIMCHEAVVKVTIGTFERAPKSKPEGRIRYMGETSYGVFCKADDEFKTREVYIFLKKPASDRKTMVEYLERYRMSARETERAARQ